MSHHSEDNFMAGSDSFWEPGNFKRTTKRIEDGNKLCNEFILLVQERADIEKGYAKQLKTWAAKWNNTIEKGPEYGTTEAAWKSILVESDRRCDLHTRVKEDLNIKVINQLKQWQKDNYHKSMMQLKEKKDMDDQFKKVQKPWAKCLAKVTKAKLEYHTACKNEKTAINQERNASGDSALSPDQVSQANLKKLQDRVSKSKDQVNKGRESYQVALQDINNYNAKYMEEMTNVFEQCQRIEAQRLQQFKDILFSVQKCLNISEDIVLPQIYEEFYHTVNNADHEKDLKWWSNTYGVNMPMNWPQFEEYTEEFREIATKSKKITSGTVADGNITLINQRHVGDDLPEYTSSSSNHQRSNGDSKQHRNGGTKANNHNQTSTTNSGALSRTVNNSEPSYRTELSNGGPERTPFDEEEWDEDGRSDPLVDNGEPGVKVRALYDYEAAENDELAFNAGDTFEKLEDEDEQGWCKGRKDGKVGLYPANYIEVI
jgi:hypothetical protein